MIVKEFEIKAIYIPNAIKMFFVQKIFKNQYNIYHILISTIVHITTTRLRDSIYFSIFHSSGFYREKESKHNKRLAKLLKLSISKSSNVEISFFSKSNIFPLSEICNKVSFIKTI